MNQGLLCQSQILRPKNMGVRICVLDWWLTSAEPPVFSSQKCLVFNVSTYCRDENLNKPWPKRDSNAGPATLYSAIPLGLWVPLLLLWNP